jgi:hypothetical protein
MINKENDKSARGIINNNIRGDESLERPAQSPEVSNFIRIDALCNECDQYKYDNPIAEVHREMIFY